MSSSYQIHCRDAVAFLKKLPDQSVDLLITDPPYESLEKYRAIGTTTRLKGNWFEIFPNLRYQELFKEVHRVLKKNAHFYMMCDQETMFLGKPIGEQVGFKFWKALVWKKGNSIGMGYHYRANHEMILFFEKGKRKLNNLGIPDVITVDKIRNAQYPTEKPVKLLDVLINQSSISGEVVCDPFCGSGSCGEAAIRSGRFFLGNDKSKKAAQITRKRLKKTQSALKNIVI